MQHRCFVPGWRCIALGCAAAYLKVASYRPAEYCAMSLILGILPPGSGTETLERLVTVPGTETAVILVLTLGMMLPGGSVRAREHVSQCGPTGVCSAMSGTEIAHDIGMYGTDIS
eukprot:1184441-Rhodomonas_salina.1